MGCLAQQGRRRRIRTDVRPCPTRPSYEDTHRRAGTRTRNVRSRHGGPVASEPAQDVGGGRSQPKIDRAVIDVQALPSSHQGRSRPAGTPRARWSSSGLSGRTPKATDAWQHLDHVRGGSGPPLSAVDPTHVPRCPTRPRAAPALSGHGRTVKTDRVNTLQPAGKRIRPVQDGSDKAAVAVLLLPLPIGGVGAVQPATAPAGRPEARTPSQATQAHGDAKGRFRCDELHQCR